MKLKVTGILSVVIFTVCMIAGCSGSKLEGTWISDVNSNTEICFIDDEFLTVKTGDTVLDGVYYVEGDKIELTINSPYSSETVEATYEIVEKNKLLLTNINGETEQFLRK